MRTSTVVLFVLAVIGLHLFLNRPSRRRPVDNMFGLHQPPDL